MFCAVALYYKSLNVLLVIKAYLFSIICSILYLAYSLKISTKLSLKLKEVNQIFVPWKYGIKYWVSQIVSTSNDKFDQILLSFILPSSSLGIFATAVGVSKLTARIPSSYTQVFFNQIAVKSQIDALTLLEKAHRVTLALSVFMSFFLSACATKIIVLLYGNDYRVSLVVILAYLPGLICQICARLIIKFFSAQGKPLKNAAIYSFGFFCGLPLYFLLVPKLGLTGASICSSVSYFISYLFSIYQLAKNYNVDWKYFYVIKWDDMRHIYNLFCRLINRR
jgi:O-antigen/teichoic acid export membrane protein